MAEQSARISLVGHSHVALWFSDGEGLPGADGGGQAEGGRELDLTSDRWLLNPGSVGQPRDGDPRAAYLVLDRDQGRVTWHRVEYDIDGVQTAMRSVGLPDRLAARLTFGV
jgi:diadenosine tetraphosphatase ApaH/serine/threonine PP2A family protein phosphatase